MCSRATGTAPRRRHGRLPDEADQHRPAAGNAAALDGHATMLPPRSVPRFTDRTRASASPRGCRRPQFLRLPASLPQHWSFRGALAAQHLALSGKARASLHRKSGAGEVAADEARQPHKCAKVPPGQVCLEHLPDEFGRPHIGVAATGRSRRDTRHRRTGCSSESPSSAGPQTTVRRGAFVECEVYMAPATFRRIGPETAQGRAARRSISWPMGRRTVDGRPRQREEFEGDEAQLPEDRPPRAARHCQVSQRLRPVPKPSSPIVKSPPSVQRSGQAVAIVKHVAAFEPAVGATIKVVAIGLRIGHIALMPVQARSGAGSGVQISGRTVRGRGDFRSIVSHAASG